ncbi:MAG: MauE/DoxX family redox-associated membrane protein [Candidatus Korobacteraceae bacterium]
MGASSNVNQIQPSVPSSVSPRGQQASVATNLETLADKTALRTKTIVVVGFVASLLLSPKLWVSSRFYPLVPVFHGLPRIPYPLDYLCFGVVLLLLVAIAFAPRPRPYLVSFVAFIALYSLLDQTRWQPWAYQYWLMLIALGCFSWKPDDIRGRQDAVNICRLIMGCTYFYSGLQKLNSKFVVEGFPWVLGTLHLHIPVSYLNYLGWTVPFIEVSIGLCLLTRRFRKIGIVNGIVMHLFILYSFGPLGLDWNSVVWPWNVAMIALILVLFWNTDVTFADIVWRNKFVYQKVVLVLLGVLPALSFIGRWPSDLSLALYTDNLTEANVLISESVKQDLPVFVQQFIKPQPGHIVLRTQDWSFGELNVPPYAEIQSFTSIGSEVCKYAHDSPDIVLSGYEKNTLLGPGKEIRNTCFGTLVVHP